VGIAEQALTDAEHGGTVPGHERGERIGVAANREGGHEIGIGRRVGG
jgi:hypothetical protein